MTRPLLLSSALALACCVILGRACAAGAAPELDAARCLVAETDAREPDLSATAHVLVRRARRYHRSPSQEARRYCAMFVARQPSARQAAIAVLVPASSVRGRQLEVAIEALDAASRGGPDPCALPADHWGDRYADAARARRAGWLAVDCGETRDAYWLATVRAAR